MKSAVAYCPHIKFTALICCSGSSVCKHSGITAQGFALVCTDFPFFLFSFFFFFFWGMSDQIQADVDRKQTQYLFSSSSTINQLHIFPDSLPGSDPSDRVPHQSASCHSAVCMLLTWFTCLGPDAFKELRFSSLLMMSVHVFLYWCRSREYTKGSQAALL